MSKPRKTKVLHFTDDGGFTIATTVHGRRSRTLHGRPRINAKTNSVVVGCMYMTRAAVSKLHQLMSAPGLYQDGNYKSVEDS